MKQSNVDLHEEPSKSTLSIRDTLNGFRVTMIDINKTKEIVGDSVETSIIVNSLVLSDNDKRIGVDKQSDGEYDITVFGDNQILNNIQVKNSDLRTQLEVLTNAYN